MEKTMKCSHISLNLYAGLFKESNMLVNPPQAKLIAKIIFLYNKANVKYKI